MSRAEPPPAIPSNDSSKNGSAVATLPASTLSRATASKPASPPAETTCPAVAAATYSESGTSDAPPGLMARKNTSSCLNVVGCSTTRAPFESVHSVMPAPGRVFSATIDPAVGGSARSTPSGASST